MAGIKDEGRYAIFKFGREARNPADGAHQGACEFLILNGKIHHKYRSTLMMILCVLALSTEYKVPSLYLSLSLLRTVNNMLLTILCR